MNLIGFPRLGLGPFEITHTAFSIGPVSVQWYGIIIVFGMFLACLYAFWRMKSVPLVTDDMLDIAIVCIPCGIVGARLYYVLTSLEDFPTFWDVFKIWEGGLAIYGGIIGGFLGIFAVCRHKKKSLLAVLDCIAPGVLIGQLVGRWGNFVNAEAYGVIGPYDFLGHTFDASFLSENNPFIMTINGMYVHPTFLYESVWNFIGFLLINAFWKHKKYNGQIVLLYLTWYGFGRAVIEGFRGDSLYIGSLRISQLLAALCFVLGVFLLIVFAVKKPTRKESATENQIKA